MKKVWCDNMKLYHIVARHQNKLVNVDLYYPSIKAAKHANPYLKEFKIVGSKE